jgi:hypothetical protein
MSDLDTAVRGIEVSHGWQQGLKDGRGNLAIFFLAENRQ